MNGIFPPISLWGGPLDGAIIELTPLNKHAGYQVPHVDKLGNVLSHPLYRYHAVKGREWMVWSQIRVEHWPGNQR